MEVVFSFSFVFALLCTILVSNMIARSMSYYNKKTISSQYSKLVQVNRITHSQKVGITLITGFLGSGKTTLCNHILSRSKQKIAFIVNEIGRIGIDHDLIKSNMKDENDVVLLSNGCLCCTGVESKNNNEIINVLKKLVLLSTSTSKYIYDNIIIETSGLVDPTSLVKVLFELNSEIDNKLYLDSVITVVDAKNFMSCLKKVECLNQIVAADVLVVNKLDLISKNIKGEIFQSIQDINPIAQIYETIQSNVEIEKLLNIHAFDIGSNFRQQSLKESEKSTCSHTGYDSISLTHDKNPIHFEKFDQFLKQICLENNIYRIKGILWIHNNPNELVLQGICNHIESGIGRPINDIINKTSRLVFIGVDLNKSLISNLFQELISS